MLLGAGINPLLKNNDKKIAFELLLEDEKRSIQLLQKYNPPVTVLPCRKERSVQVKQQISMKGDVTKEKDESNMRILESTPREKQTNQLGAKKKEKVVDKTNLEREHNQTHLLEDKCHGCRDKFIKFQKAILEDSTTSLVELSRLIKLKHKGPIHKEITENSIKLITDFLAESEVIDIPPELCRISQKLFNRIIDDLKHQQKWLPVCKLAVIHSKVHGENQYSGFAAGIPLDIVLYHLTENNFSRKAIEIIDWFFHNGGTVADGGRNCIKIFTERKHYQLIETLVCINECDPRHLSIYSGDTPIHAALDIAVQIDHDDLSIFKKCMELYDKNSIRYRYLNPERRDENGDTLYHLIAKHKLSKSTQKLADILQKRQIRYKIQNKEGKYPHDYVKVDDPRSKIFQKAIEYETNTLRKSQKLCKTIDMPKTQSASVATNLNTETIRTKSNTSDYKEINTPNDKEENDKPVVAKLDIKIEDEPEIKESNLSQIKQMIKSLENKQKPKAEKDDKDGTEHNLSHAK
ncbi:uncharacterized protein LOC143061050 [Mytilus galloprovincialis]|uniref:uncharacterized protein LOC143061050 n=1 Tax=Mytilus galloprovincialis TaxID=29158 RepID=UPI003F7C8591